MGRPKLLLPLRESTVIEQTLAAWRQTPVAAIVAVVRQDDPELAAVCRRSGAEVVVPPAPPPEMRDSVALALAHVEKTHGPGDRDVWLLAPADMPNLSPQVVSLLLANHQPQQPAILVPTMAGRRGHPVLFFWPMAAEVSRLPAGEGINALTRRSLVREVSCEAAACPAAFEDLDTPNDYEGLMRPNSRQ